MIVGGGGLERFRPSAETQQEIVDAERYAAVGRALQESAPEGAPSARWNPVLLGQSEELQRRAGKEYDIAHRAPAGPRNIDPLSPLGIERAVERATQLQELSAGVIDTGTATTLMREADELRRQDEARLKTDFRSDRGRAYRRGELELDWFDYYLEAIDHMVASTLLTREQAEHLKTLDPRSARPISPFTGQR
jgi:hypothetical protein